MKHYFCSASIFLAFISNAIFCCSASQQETENSRRVTEVLNEGDLGQNFGFQSRIVGGTVASPQDYDFMVNLGGCGGTFAIGGKVAWNNLYIPFLCCNFSISTNSDSRLHFQEVSSTEISFLRRLIASLCILTLHGLVATQSRLAYAGTLWELERDIQTTNRRFKVSDHRSIKVEAHSEMFQVSSCLSFSELYSV